MIVQCLMLVVRFGIQVLHSHCFLFYTDFRMLSRKGEGLEAGLPLLEGTSLGMMAKMTSIVEEMGTD